MPFYTGTKKEFSLFELQRLKVQLSTEYAATQSKVEIPLSNYKKDNEIREDVILEGYDGPLAGQDKYLGGEMGADGCVYGVPGKSSDLTPTSF